MLGQLNILTRSNGKLPFPNAYDAIRGAYYNMDMAYYNAIHVLKTPAAGGSAALVVKYDKAFTAKTDVISAIELPVQTALAGTEVVHGKLSVTQDSSGNDRIAACLIVTTVSTSFSMGVKSSVSTTVVSYWSVTTQSDSNIVASYGLTSSDMEDCHGVNAGTNGINYAIMKHTSGKLMFVQATDSTSTSSMQMQASSTQTGFQTPQKVVFLDQGSNYD